MAHASAVWTLEDENGIPAPDVGSGRRAMPFWSSRERVERVIAAVPAYAGFCPVEVLLAEFEQRWFPGLERLQLRSSVCRAGAARLNQGTSHPRR